MRNKASILKKIYIVMFFCYLFMSFYIVINFLSSRVSLESDWFLNSVEEIPDNNEIVVIDNPVDVIIPEPELDNDFTIEEKRCLTLNIYHEARGDNYAGKLAVADVVMNRVQHTEFPDTVCGVVKESKLNNSGVPKKNECQFSWYCDGVDDEPKDDVAWMESEMIAEQVFNYFYFSGISEGATYYHKYNSKPAWRKQKGMKLIGRIGDHVFYRLD